MTMIQVKAETTKVVTTKLWWLLALTLVVLAGAGSSLLTVAVSAAGSAQLPLDTPSGAGVVYNLAVGLAYVVPFALGVLLVTSDLHQGTLSISAVGEPRRLRIFAAKVAVAIGVCALYGAATVGAGVLGGALSLSASGYETHLLSPEVTSRLAGGVACFALWGALGLGIGALVKNQLVAIIGIVVFTQFLEPVVRIVAADSQLTRFLPGAVSDAAAGGTLISMATGEQPLLQAQALGILAFYAAALACLGALRFRRYELA